MTVVQMLRRLLQYSGHELHCRGGGSRTPHQQCECGYADLRDVIREFLAMTSSDS
jgi:uncharacterized protein YdiU (UPF0061 family)